MTVGAGWIGADLELSIEPGGGSYLLILSRGDPSRLHCRGEVTVVGQDTGALVSPTMGCTYRIPLGFRSLTIALDRRGLAAELRALTGVHPGAPLEFERALDLRSGSGAEIGRVLRFITETIDGEPTILTSRLVLANFVSAFTTSLLLGQPHNHSRLFAREPASPAPGAVRLAEAYIDANAAEPITMSGLASVAGVSARALQAGFRAHRGCSPMVFLKERRLELARRRLASARPGVTVTDVAYACGFSHLGRFSQEYGRRFGESPSSTLRRALLQWGERGASAQALIHT